ncbi:MAG: hypothetical protein J6A19_14535 [Oscillospiraceae bacterium]|nr:hypothetical protein [Oscillospiraceae bacterium]
MKPVSLCVILATLILNSFNANTINNTPSSDTSITETNKDNTPSYEGEKPANPIAFWEQSVLSVLEHIEDESPDYSNDNSDDKSDDNVSWVNPDYNSLTIKQGDYTAGGYLPTTVNPKYQYNGLNYWDNNQGTLFRENETEDLYNWVSAGYTRWRTEDVRIASRKGGTNNPRIATYLSLDNNDNWAAAKDYEYCYVTVKMGTYKNGKVSDELREICESVANYTDENKESCKKAEKLAEAYLAMHDMEDELNWYADEKGHPDEHNTTVGYNCRNYCGDTISIDVYGYGINRSNVISDGSGGFSAAGVDYTLTCDEDPDAFKLVSGDELKKLYEVERHGKDVYADSAYYVNAAFVNDGAIPYLNAYIGVKPGIYRCTITVTATGEKVPIVIENLPVHYKELMWGCANQEEMDFCVQFMQAWDYGVYNHYYHTRSGWACANKFEIPLNKATEEDKMEVLREFNSREWENYEGEVIQLKETAEAAEWLAHLPHQFAAKTLQKQAQMSIFQQSAITNNGNNPENFPNKCTKYDALDAILYGANDCESISAAMECLYNVLGYTTRYITGGNHSWFEVKVPASITKSGVDMWIMVDMGQTGGGVSAGQFKTHIDKEVEGFNHDWWTTCYNDDIAHGRNP